MKQPEGIDRVNRLSLALIGVLSAAAGGAGLASGTGLLGDEWRDRFVGDGLFGAPPGPPVWVGLAVVVFALIMVYVSLRWLVLQVQVPPRVGSLDLKSGGRGRTELKGSALEHAIDANLKRLPGATSTRVLLRKNGTEPSLDIRLEVADDADVSELLESAGKVLPGAAAVAGMQKLHASIRLFPVRPPRVR